MKPVTTRPVRAIGYVRVSTEEQVREGVSLDAQRSEIAKFCAENGLELIKIFADEGISGTTPKRPGLIEMEAFMAETHERGERLTLAVWKIDRLWRKQRLLLGTLDTITDWRFGFVSVTENLDTTTTTGYFTLGIMGAVSELFVNQIRERTRMALAQVKKEDRRIGHSMTYGFRCIEKRGLMLMPHELAVIETILGWFYVDGLTCNQVHSMIVQRDLPVPHTSRWCRNLLYEKPAYLAVMPQEIRDGAAARGKSIPVFPDGYIEDFDPTLASLTPRDRERTAIVLGVV